jgi:hypothetical protein
MRRQSRVLQALFALAVLWLAAGSVGGSRSEPGTAFASVHGETFAVSAPQAIFGGIAAAKKTSPADWAGRLFLPSRGFVLRHDVATAPSTFELSGIGERASRTITYDATAPPIAIQNTVR